MTWKMWALIAGVLLFAVALAVGFGFAVQWIVDAIPWPAWAIHEQQRIVAVWPWLCGCALIWWLASVIAKQIGALHVTVGEIRDEVRRTRIGAERRDEREESRRVARPTAEVERQLVRIGSELTTLRVIAEAQAKAAGIVVPEAPEWFVLQRIGRG